MFILYLVLVELKTEQQRFTLDSMRRDLYPQKFGGLGFRNLHDFNIALHAKQLWRLLIHYLNSLLARVLKGRYYNHTSPLEDRRTYSSSYG